MKIYSFIFLFFIACSSSPVPKNIMPPDSIKPVVYDLMQIDEYLNNFLSKDSTLDIKKERSMYYEKIFKMHNTNRKDFYASFKYYQQHPDIQKALYDSLFETVKKKKNEVIKIKPTRGPK